MKPSIEYLDSLNDYRKRSRSMEDVGAAGKKKVAKMGEANGYGNGLDGGSSGGGGNGYVVTAEPDTIIPPEDDPIVHGMQNCFTLMVTNSSFIVFLQ